MSAHAYSVEATQVEDARLVAALRRGDERAFAEVVESYHTMLLRMAMVYVHNRAVAEDVVQEAWIGVLRGLERFEGRSSFKTWVCRILTNIAKTRAVREGRSIPFAALESDTHEPSVPADRFERHGAFIGHWLSPPPHWSLPDERLHSKETLSVIADVVSTLPPTQRAVISLRDIEGCSSEEVCELLSLSEGNQRVLLHRARSKVRAALEDFLADVEN